MEFSYRTDIILKLIIVFIKKYIGYQCTLIKTYIKYIDKCMLKSANLF